MWVLLCLWGVLGCASGTKVSVSKTDRARMLVEIANGALLEGDPVGALQQLARAEEFDRSLPELHHSKALAYHKRKNTQEALLEAKEAVRLKPDYSDANNTLGRLLMDAGRLQEALEPLKLAAKDALYRESYKAWTNLGILHYQKKEYDQAKEHWTQAILSSPSYACVAYYYRGLLFSEQGSLREAILDYQQATRKFCVGYAEADLALGLAYQKNQQVDLARQVYLEVQERYPHTDFASEAMKRLHQLP
jgi:type IV pilus assembly protein PilF